MKRIKTALAISMLMAGVVQADTIDWVGGGADSEWSTQANWDATDTDDLPGALATDTTRFQAGDTATVNSAVTSPFAVKVLLRSGGEVVVKADMDSLSAIDVAKSSSTAATATQFTHSGAGTVTVSGAVIIGGDDDSTGKYRQTAGTLDAGSITVQANGTYQTIGNNKTKSVTTTSMTIQNGGVADFGGQQLTVNATALNVGDTGAGTVNQTGAGSVVTSAGLNVGAGGAYNLTSGTLTSTAATTLNGTVAINGGTLTLDTVGNNDITVGGSGLLELTSGTWNDTAAVAQDLTTFNADIAISGGLLDLSGQNRFNGEFKVTGDAATINIARINDAGLADYVFEFGDAGISTITSSEYLQLLDSTITVDVGTYTGGNGDFTLFEVNNTAAGAFILYANAGDIDVSSFEAAGFTGTYISQDVDDNNKVILHVIPEPAVLSLVVIFGGGILVLKRRFS